MVDEKHNRGIKSEGFRVRERILKRIEECERNGESVLPLITLPKNLKQNVSEGEGVETISGSSS